MERLNIPTVRSPLQRLEEAIQTLNLKSHLTPEERWLEYENLFKRWFSWNPTTTTTNAATMKVLPPSSSQPAAAAAANILNPTEQTMIETLPKSYRERARQLLIFIKQTDDFKSGNLTLDNVLGVDGSTLLHYALRNKKKNKVQPPVAWDRFISFLRRNNIDEKQTNLLAFEHRKSSAGKRKRLRKPTPPAVATDNEAEPPAVVTVTASGLQQQQKGKGPFFPLAGYQDYWWTSL